MSVAFFDLDLTVLDVNSVSLWVRAEQRAGLISRVELIRATWALLKYRLGFVDLEPLIREAMANQRGQLEAEFNSRVQHFYESEIRQHLRPGAADALSRHTQAGDQTVILTTSSMKLAQACASGFGFSDAIGSQFETTAHGRFTGNPIEPLCFGAGKVAWARTWCAAHEAQLEEATFYTDSISDRAMLEAVSTPVVVNGDPRLDALARANEWSRVDWGRS